MLTSRHAFDIFDDDESHKSTKNYTEKFHFWYFISITEIDKSTKVGFIW
jgi:hypothetical protein